MNVPDCARFLSECITTNPGKQTGLRGDEMYGLYLSWCFLNAEEPVSAELLAAAMSRQGPARPQVRGGQLMWPGLSMTGPAAVDYILASQPSLL